MSNEVRVISTNGKNTVKYFPAHLANNAAFLKRNGYIIATVEKQEEEKPFEVESFDGAGDIVVVEEKRSRGRQKKTN